MKRKARGTKGTVKNRSITMTDCGVNNVQAEVNSTVKEVGTVNEKDVTKPIKKPKKIIKTSKVRKKLNVMDTVYYKKKKQMTILKPVKRQKCSTITETNGQAVLIKKKPRPTVMELSNSTVENQTVSDNSLSSDDHEDELDPQPKSPIISTSNIIKNKFAELKVNRKSTVNNKESHQKQRKSKSCTTNNDEVKESHHRPSDVVPTNSIVPQKRKIVPEQNCRTNSYSVIAQQGNNFKIKVNVDGNKLPTDMQRLVQEKHDGDLKTVNRSSSYKGSYNEASEDEELQPVNKRIYVESSIDGAAKTCGSVTDKSIQSSIAEKDNSAIKSPSPHILPKKRASDGSGIEDTINYVVKTYSAEPSQRLAIKQNNEIKDPYVRLEKIIVNPDMQPTSNLNNNSFRKKIKKTHLLDVRKKNLNLINFRVSSKANKFNQSNSTTSTAPSQLCAKQNSQEMKNIDFLHKTFTLSNSLNSKPSSTKSLLCEPSTNVITNSTSSSNSREADLSINQQETSLIEPDSSTANIEHLKSKNSLQEGTCTKTPDSSTSSVMDTSVNTHYQDSKCTNMADSSTSSSNSSALLNATTSMISPKNEKSTNMADSSTSSINVSNTTDRQSEMANALESDVLINQYNIAPALLNIKITRNIAANSDDRIIQLIPQPKCCDVQENNCSSKPEFILDYRGYEEEDSWDDNDDSCNDWTLVYNFTTEESIRILSHDGIFKEAVLASTATDTISECSSQRSEPSEMGSQFTSLRIVREDNSTHRIVSSITSTDTESNVSQQSFQFKMPVLPPAKRPPTRLKSSKSDTSLGSRSPGLSESSNSTNSDTSTVTNQVAELLSITKLSDSHRDDADDAISLYAGTIKESYLEDCPPPTENLEALEDVKLHVEATSNGNNVQSRPNPQMELPKEAVTLPESDIMIMNWIADGKEAIKSNPKAEPLVFNKLCKFHFGRRRCVRGRYCTRKHSLPTDMPARLKNLSHEDLVRNYNFTKNKNKLFEQTIHAFIQAYEERRLIPHVISFVKDIMNVDIFDRTPLINNIIEALQRMDMAFSVAVEMIAAQQRTNIGLSDILLFIICVQHKDELIKNWNLVQKLIQYRNHHLIDHHLLEDLITECCYKKSEELCKNVMKDIISQKIVEVQRISFNKINNFISVLRYLELKDEERILLDVMREYNIVIAPVVPTNDTSTTQPSTSLDNKLTTPNAISNQYNSNRNMTNSCLVDENAKQFSECQKSDTRDLYIKTNSDTQYVEPEHGENIGNSETHEAALSASVKLPNEDFHGLQFDADKFQGTDISRNLNPVSQNIETGSNRSILSSSRVSDKDVKSNFDEDLSLPQNGLFATNRELPFHISSRNELDFAKNVNVSGRRLSISHHSSSSIIDRDVTNNIGIQYVYEPEIGFISSSSTSSIDSSPGNEMFDSTEKDLEESEVKALLDIILSPEFRLMDFLAMFHTYKDTPLKEAFIVHVVGLFKRKTPMEIYNMILQVMTGLQQQGTAYINDENTEIMLCMLIVNTVAVLYQQRSFQKAAQLLVKFYMNLKRLTQTKWLRSIHSQKYSDVGKYLHFCQIFVKGGYLQEAADLLMAPDLRLLYGSNMWTLQCHENHDTDFRNDILDELITVALRINIPVAKKLILQLITDKDNITEIEIWRHFNDLVLHMLNCNDSYIEDIKEILPNILQGWYKHLTKPVMRGLLVKLVMTDVPGAALVTLYKKCSKQKIYQHIKGNEEKLVLRTDFKHEEIYMTMHYLFTKIAKFNFPIHEITLSIKLSDSVSSHPNIMFNSDVSVPSLKARVYTVLACSFKYAIHVHNNENEPYIKISPDEIRQCINHYKKTAGVPNCSSFWVRQLTIDQMQKETSSNQCT